MSKILEAIEVIAGTPLGEKGDPRAPFLEALGKRKMPVPRKNWIGGARNGKTDARKLYNRIELALAQGHRSSKKDSLYRRIAKNIVSIRTRGNGPRSVIYKSDYLMQEAEINLSLPHKTLGRLARAMRADLVFGNSTDNIQTQQAFLQIVEEFLGDHSKLTPYYSSAFVGKLDKEWDRSSPRAFYQELYSLTGHNNRSMGLWTPYEMKFMQHHYEGRIRAGSIPTVLDSATLQAKSIRDLKDLAGQIRLETGILLDYKGLVVHRNALVYSESTIVAIKH